MTNATGAAATAAEETGGDRPAKRLRISRSFYMRPDQAKEIDDACLDLPAVLREPMSPSKVFERYHDWGFQRFLAEMKGEVVAAAAAARKGRKKGGAE